MTLRSDLIVTRPRGSNRQELLWKHCVASFPAAAPISHMPLSLLIIPLNPGAFGIDSKEIGILAFCPIMSKRNKTQLE